MTGRWQDRYSALKDLFEVVGTDFDEPLAGVTGGPPQNIRRNEDINDEIEHIVGKDYFSSEPVAYERTDPADFNLIKDMIDMVRLSEDVTPYSNTSSAMKCDSHLVISRLDPNVPEFYPMHYIPPDIDGKTLNKSIEVDNKQNESLNNNETVERNKNLNYNTISTKIVESKHKDAAPVLSEVLDIQPVAPNVPVKVTLSKFGTSANIKADFSKTNRKVEKIKEELKAQIDEGQCPKSSTNAKKFNRNVAIANLMKLNSRMNPNRLVPKTNDKAIKLMTPSDFMNVHVTEKTVKPDSTSERKMREKDPNIKKSAEHTADNRLPLDSDNINDKENACELPSQDEIKESVNKVEKWLTGLSEVTPATLHNTVSDTDEYKIQNVIEENACALPLKNEESLSENQRLIDFHKSLSKSDFQSGKSNSEIVNLKKGKSNVSSPTRPKTFKPSKFANSLAEKYVKQCEEKLKANETIWERAERLMRDKEKEMKKNGQS